ELERLLQFFRIGIELPEMLGQGEMDGGVVLVDRHEAVEAAIQAAAERVAGQGDSRSQIGSCIVLMMDDLWDRVQVLLVAFQNDFFDRPGINFLLRNKPLDSL